MGSANQHSPEEPGENFAREKPRWSLPFRWFSYTVDSIAWIVGVYLAAFFRLEFKFAAVPWQPLIGLCLLLMLLQFGIGVGFGVYRGHYRSGSFEEGGTLGVATVATTIVAWFSTLVWGQNFAISRALVPIAAAIAIVIMFASRYFRRRILERNAKPAPDATPALVYGAGYVGEHLVQWLVNDRDSEYRPVGIVDDDPNKLGVRIRSVSVLGSLSDLAQIVRKTDARTLIVAIANPDPAVLRRVQDEADRAGISVKVGQTPGQALNTKVRPKDLRDLAIEDLLGRPVVDTNVAEIAGYLTGKQILVTGAGGSIGSQLCMEIKRFGPKGLIMLDRDETGLQAVLIGTAGNGLLDTPDVVLADIRDQDTLLTIFEERRPEVVFHAAALKHLPMLEQYPEEAWKTNVMGTLNVLKAARHVGVSTFVNISTDKAANPTSVLGHSKRIAEKLTSWMGQVTGQRYLSVRFGNVIGSRGSMLPTFTRLIEEGKPLTVTHPDITRYFMTIPEACQLVLQAGGVGRVGEVLILDMGEPVKILDIAQRMIAMSGKEVEIVFTGLREGEKLHEELVGLGETEDRPFHPKISHAHVRGLAEEDIDKERWERVVVEKTERYVEYNDGRLGTERVSIGDGIV